jgi:hypothetical protein
MAHERLFLLLIINIALNHNDYFAGSEIKNTMDSEDVYALHNKELSSYKHSR